MMYDYFLFIWGTGRAIQTEDKLRPDLYFFSQSYLFRHSHTLCVHLLDTLANKFVSFSPPDALSIRSVHYKKYLPTVCFCVCEVLRRRSSRVFPNQMVIFMKNTKLNLACVELPIE